MSDVPDAPVQVASMPVPPRWKRVWREVLQPVVIAVLFTQFVATMVGVDGASMMPSLRNGERVIVPKYETWLHKAGIGQYSRGDILIFRPPGTAVTSSFLGLWTYRPFLIKRLIGLPGDTVRLNQGKVYVNNRLISQTFTTAYWEAQGCWDTSSALANNASVDPLSASAIRTSITVPAGQYFVMGDNRTANGSEDSRLFGTVLSRDVAGRAALVVWPFLRRANATYDCSYRGRRPQDGVKTSGPLQENLRLLTRPGAFSLIR
ncbi:signal peptidase I [Deinococcus ruber]|uniref:Signal peptidase I n=1 Tax=Deinococcus ruber TaxID=1848197 RepID=A0A918F980_9DEIO|nr:signal peptidase I [Deinococcus ruber]GGR21021.1 signal peptidase I [Deinococcus ruber]